MECLPSQCAYTSDSVVNSDGLEGIFKCFFVDEESTNKQDMPTNRGWYVVGDLVAKRGDHASLEIAIL